MVRKQQPAEKSPVDEDFAGLQLDTRPQPIASRLKDSPPRAFDGQFGHGFTDEKQARALYPDSHYASPASPEASYGTWTAAYGSTTLSPTTPATGKPVDPDEFRAWQTSTPAKFERRVCGLSRKRFWILLISVILLVVTAGLVGGLVGGLLSQKKKSSPKPEAPANTTLPPVFPQAQKGDVMIGSPLCVISYDLRGTNTPSKRQEFRMYFQSLYGNVKEAVASGSSSWQSARPILTDALNNTGLASFTYLNGSQQQGSIFYVGTNGLLQEKRKIYADDKYWQVGKLNNLNVPMIGNMSSNVQNDDPQNSWDSYRIAAVYSRNFSTGPGARLYYHAQQTNGSSFLQELIWYQNNDTWVQGTIIDGANPSSHLAAAIDESVGALRIFFSSGNRSLQEVWTTIGPNGGNYTKTLRIDNFLNSNNADLAAVAANGTAHLYHYAPAEETSLIGIHDLAIRTTTQSGARHESFNLSEPIVTSPLLPGGTNSSLYQPIAASMTAVRDLPPQFLLFWAEKPTGDPNTNSTGYQGLAQVSRAANGDTWPKGTQMQIPLGSDDSDPH